MSTVLGGIPFSDAGALQVQLRPDTGVPSSEPVNGGWAIASALNAAYFEMAGTAVPASAVEIGGIAFTQDGAIYLTQSTTGTFADIGGHKVRSDGALLVVQGTPTVTDPVIGGWAHLASTRAAYVGGDGLSFVLPLRDLGAGAVDLTLAIGTGAATFTRATAAATKLSTGLWKLDVASGTARSSYIGLTTAVGAYGGYLAEGAATQLALDVRDMTQASWVKVTMTTAKTSTGIDGVTNSCTRLTAAGASSTILQTLTAAATSRTYSCWLKRVTGTGTILIQQGATTLDVTALINSSTFTLVQLNASVLNSAFGITISSNADAIDVDCNQFEPGAFASTPIPAAGTRNADVLTYPVTSFNQVQGTIFSQATAFGLADASAAKAITAVDAGSVNDAFKLDFSTTLGPRWNVFNASVLQANIAVGGAATGITKVAGVYAVNDFQFSRDGTLGTQDTSGTLPTVSAINIGFIGGPAQFLYGTVKDVRIWGRRLPDAAIQAITA